MNVRGNNNNNNDDMQNRMVLSQMEWLKARLNKILVMQKDKKNITLVSGLIVEMLKGIEAANQSYNEDEEWQRLTHPRKILNAQDGQRLKQLTCMKNTLALSNMVTNLKEQYEATSKNFDNSHARLFRKKSVTNFGLMVLIGHALNEISAINDYELPPYFSDIKLAEEDELVGCPRLAISAKAKTSDSQKIDLISSHRSIHEDSDDEADTDAHNSGFKPGRYSYG